MDFGFSTEEEKFKQEVYEFFIQEQEIVDDARKEWDSGLGFGNNSLVGAGNHCCCRTGTPLRSPCSRFAGTVANRHRCEFATMGRCQPGSESAQHDNLRGNTLQPLPAPW